MIDERDYIVMSVYCARVGGHGGRVYEDDVYQVVYWKLWVGWYGGIEVGAEVEVEVDGWT